MQARAVWRAVTKDWSDFLNNLIALLSGHRVRYCVIGGQGVNAYAEPLIGLDLELVVEADQLDMVESLLGEHFQLERFQNSLNVSASGSSLRVQIQPDPRYFEFPQRAGVRDVLGVRLPVAAIEDILQGKIWAVTDPKRRPSKR